MKSRATTSDKDRMAEEKGVMTRQALAGLKIVELSQGVAEPYLGKLIAG